MTQISFFDGEERLRIDKPIRLIELFAGYGSQSLALKYLGVPFEHHKICEWAIPSIQAYKDLHATDDNTDYSQGMTVEEVFEHLAKQGVSSNYNEPMTYDQIKRMGEDRCRTIYNNIKATNNLVSVCNAHGKDFEITDRDKYCYVLTYSFPCQDLSKAGKGKGMAKDSGTRSGLLWEVERILDELNAEGGNLPHILLMENVPDVIGTNNIKHFADWVKKLDSLGYTSKWQCMNAKNYGVPQNRDRCFMVSWLGDFYYDFPQEKKLTKRLKDVLETEVDEKYYLSIRTIEQIASWNSQQNPLEKVLGENSICPCVTARGAGECHSGMVLYCNELKETTDLRSNYLVSSGKVREKQSYRFRTLTPKECGRLMGVKDEDIDKMSANQSNSKLYHLYGDSIVVDALMEIFKQML